MKEYQVNIHYRGCNSYIVKANSDVEAEALAKSRFDDGDNGEVLGVGFEVFDKFGDVTELDKVNK